MNARVAWRKDEQAGHRQIDPPQERQQRDHHNCEGESQAEDHVAAGPFARFEPLTRPASEATSDASVGVVPIPIRAPTLAGSGGSRYVDSSFGPRRLGEDLDRRAIEDHPAVAHDDDPLERLGDERACRG